MPFGGQGGSDRVSEAGRRIAAVAAVVEEAEDFAARSWASVETREVRLRQRQEASIISLRLCVAIRELSNEGVSTGSFDRQAVVENVSSAMRKLADRAEAQVVRHRGIADQFTAAARAFASGRGRGVVGRGGRFSQSSGQPDPEPEASGQRLPQAAASVEQSTSGGMAAAAAAAEEPASEMGAAAAAEEGGSGAVAEAGGSGAAAAASEVAFAAVAEQGAGGAGSGSRQGLSGVCRRLCESGSDHAQRVVEDDPPGLNILVASLPTYVGLDEVGIVRRSVVLSHQLECRTALGPM